MGWTYSPAATLMLNRYPAFANIPELLERWPALRQAVAQQQIAGAGQGVESQSPESGNPAQSPNPTSET